MVTVIKDLDDIKLILQRLEERPMDEYKYGVEGVLRSNLDGAFNYGILLDKWPDFTCIMLHPETPEENRVYLYSNDSGSLEKFISQQTVLQRSGRRLVFAGVDPALSGSLKEACERIGRPLTLIRTSDLFYLPPMDTPCEPALVPGFTLGSLQPSHAGLLMTHWDFAQKRMPTANFQTYTSKIEKAITKNISSCVYNASEEPVSWMIMTIDGSFGIFHTLEAYRRNGLGMIVIQDLRAKASKQGVQFYGHIEKGNHVMRHIVTEALGGTILGETHFLMCMPGQ